MQAEISCYSILGGYLEYVSFQAGTIDNQKTCPNELMEAIQSIFFSSLRLTHIPELKDMTTLIGPKYGKVFIKRSLYNLDNKVDPILVEKLTNNPTLYDTLTLLQDISPNEARKLELSTLKNDIENNINLNLDLGNLNETEEEIIENENNENQKKKENTGNTNLPPINWESKHIYPVISPNDDNHITPTAPPFHDENQEEKK